MQATGTSGSLFVETMSAELGGPNVAGPTHDQDDVIGRPPVARHVSVTGRVQGVFFRASTREQARSHGVVGWVRNTADGRVEAHLQGPPDGVEALLAWMRAGGPEWAAVDRVDVETVAQIEADHFQVRF